MIKALEKEWKGGGGVRGETKGDPRGGARGEAKGDPGEERRETGEWKGLVGSLGIYNADHDGLTRGRSFTGVFA